MVDFCCSEAPVKVFVKTGSMPNLAALNNSMFMVNRLVSVMVADGGEWPGELV